MTETKLRTTDPEPARQLLRWYDENRRDLPWRRDPSPYHVWLSEIMLQQTRVEAVRAYYERFLARLPDIQALADAEEDVYLKLWEGLGYYSRARNLKKAAGQILERFGGELDKWTRAEAWRPHTTLYHGPGEDLQALCRRLSACFSPFPARVCSLAFSRVLDVGYEIVCSVALLPEPSGRI